MMDVKKLAEEAESYIVERRRYYHARPELTCEEKNTRDSIHRDLEALEMYTMKLLMGIDQ